MKRKICSSTLSRNKILLWSLVLLLPILINSPVKIGPIPGFVSEATFVTEATEIISVVRIGVSLVQYIYDVFSEIARDSGAADYRQG